MWCGIVTQTTQTIGHWLNRDYIGKNDGKIIDFSFKLDDNTFLSKRYIDSIKAATPQGKFYDRDILGKHLPRC